MKKLSIVIPAFNVMNYIGRTLQSIFIQNRDDIEVLIINDGSSDETEEVVRRTIKQFGVNNAELHCKENEGVSVARNDGIARASGEYVMFLDGDDYLTDGAVQRIVDVVSITNSDILHWPYDLVSEQGKVIRKFPYTDYAAGLRKGVQTVADIVLHESTKVWTGSAVYRKDLLVNSGIRFAPGCVAGEDIEFILKALFLAESVYFSNEILSCYVQRNLSVMHRYNIRKFDAVLALERVKSFLAHQREGSEIILPRLAQSKLVIDSYIGTYRMCLVHLVNGESLRLITAKKKLDKGIAANYPGLSDRMHLMIRKSLREKLVFRFVTFQMSPIIYYYAAKAGETLLINKRHSTIAAAG